MAIAEIARDFVALCKEGKFAEAGEKYWAEDVVSIEAMGDDPISHGIAAARGKGEWWANAHEIHAADAHGPYINGDQFAVRFEIDTTFKETGQRNKMDEIALYTLRDDKIDEERFLYGG